jgi:hypothetical protein
MNPAIDKKRIIPYPAMSTKNLPQLPGSLNPPAFVPIQARKAFHFPDILRDTCNRGQGEKLQKLWQKTSRRVTFNNWGD